MTKIDRVIRQVSDLRDFYLKIRKTRRPEKLTPACRANAGTSTMKWLRTDDTKVKP